MARGSAGRHSRAESTTEPQAILLAPTESAIFLVLCVNDGAEDDARDLLRDVSGLIRSVGFRVPDGGLACVVGLGSALWDRLVGAAASGGPASLRRADRVTAHGRGHAG